MRHALCLLVLILGQAGGQPSKTTSQGRSEILEYPLTMERANQLIAALPEMTAYVISLPPEVLAKSMKQSPAERLANLEKDAKGMAILKKHGLTAREYVVGVPALRMALWLAEGRAPSELVYASPANLAFAKAHMAELRPKWDAADGASRQR
jgi:hypothetical protein